MASNSNYTKIPTTNDIESQLQQPEIELQETSSNSATINTLQNGEIDENGHIHYHIHVDSPLVAAVDYRNVIIFAIFMTFFITILSLAAIRGAVVDLSNAYIIAHKQQAKSS